MDVSITISHSIGSMHMHHTYNGATPYGRKWMLCNGDIINQTNYDAQHGTGAYERDCVASSPIVGKYLPNMVNKYPVGAAATTQTGSSAIGPVGLESHWLVQGAHSHKWYDARTAGLDDLTWNNVYSPVAITPNAKSDSVKHIAYSNTESYGIDDSYTDTAGGISQSIQPESIQVVYIMRVI